LVEDLVGELEGQSVLNNTYVVFTSDNGWHHGEHRISNRKHQVYEESIHMPLVIRGPGVAAGESTDKLAFYPTFAELGGTTPSSKVDGRSLQAVLEGTATSWRSAILLEKRHKTREGQSFFGILTSEPRKYVEYNNGERELYSLRVDPYELENRYSGTPGGGLKARLDDLKTCSGATCRSAEGG
jgi:N-acetylglucosamine-6-sulfatase